MWVPRAPKEREQWLRSALKEARHHGLRMGGAVWALMTLLTSSGSRLIYSRFAVAASSRPTAPGFWTALPIAALAFLPVGFILYLWNSRRELARIHTRTICAKCDIAGSENPGAPCACGGMFELASTLKWLESK
ncbi:MAG TPA: hypothetical protein VE981_18030 [Planctomycetota bacterium]|nr:hypothetical protein [Planctomycetota bacterium]